MTKQQILDHFCDINLAYNNCNKLNDLSTMLNELLKERPKITRCKDCKHRPEVKKYTRFGREEEYYVFPEGSKCPCQNTNDDYFSWNPEDNWFCADGEPRDGDQE